MMAVHPRQYHHLHLYKSSSHNINNCNSNEDDDTAIFISTPECSSPLFQFGGSDIFRNVDLFHTTINYFIRTWNIVWSRVFFVCFEVWNLSSHGIWEKVDIVLECFNCVIILRYLYLANQGSFWYCLCVRPLSRVHIKMQVTVHVIWHWWDKLHLWG